MKLWLLDVRLPHIRARLGQSEVREDAVHKIADHVRRGCRLAVKRGDHRKDCRAGVRRKLHVAEMDFIERRLTHAEQQRAPLLQTDIRGALIRFAAMPLAMPASVPMEQGSTIMPAEG